jgi:hypothetical protein
MIERDINRGRQYASSNSALRGPDWRAVGIVLAMMAAPRVCLPGTTFESPDNAELAFRLLTRPGCAWMKDEHYGFLINVLVKLHAAALTWLRTPVTKFGGKAPVAAMGVTTIPVTCCFLRRLGSCRSGGLYLTSHGYW